MRLIVKLAHVDLGEGRTYYCKIPEYRPTWNLNSVRIEDIKWSKREERRSGDELKKFWCFSRKRNL